MSLPFCPRRGARHVPAVRRRRIPPLRFSEKHPARQGRTRLRSSRAPAFRCRERSRPDRANPPAAVRAPRLSGAEKEPPVRGEPADAVRAPRSAGAKKTVARQGEPADAVRAPRSAGAERSRPLGANPPAAVRVPRSAGAENPGNPEKIFPAEKAAKRLFSR